MGAGWMHYLIFIIVYTYLMAFIPGVNQVLRVLTLEIFQPNWFIQSLIIAFEIGFLPMMLQEYKAYKKRREYLKSVLAKKVYEKTADAWFKHKNIFKGV